jgi:hypothetical protein
MEKKVLMKIRMRQDGQWEHVYTDGSVDQEFYPLSPHEQTKISKIYTELNEPQELSEPKDFTNMVNYLRNLK